MVSLLINCDLFSSEKFWGPQPPAWAGRPGGKGCEVPLFVCMMVVAKLQKAVCTEDKADTATEWEKNGKAARSILFTEGGGPSSRCGIRNP